MPSVVLLQTLKRGRGRRPAPSWPRRVVLPGLSFLLRVPPWGHQIQVTVLQRSLLGAERLCARCPSPTPLPSASATVSPAEGRDGASWPLFFFQKRCSAEPGTTGFPAGTPGLVLPALILGTAPLFHPRRFLKRLHWPLSVLAGPVVQLGQKAALWGQLPHGVRWVSQERRGAWETSCGPQRGGAGCPWVAVLAALFPGPGGLAPKRDDILESLSQKEQAGVRFWEALSRVRRTPWSGEKHPPSLSPSRPLRDLYHRLGRTREGSRGEEVASQTPL